MGKEIGKIVKISNNEMTVQLSKGESCSFCAAKSMCIFEGPDSAYRFIKLPARKGLKEGNCLTLEYRESSRILSAFLVFFMPILFLLAGYFLGNALFDFANRGLVGALSGLGLSVLTLYLINRLLSKSKLFIPEVTDTINPKIYQNYQWSSQH